MSRNLKTVCAASAVAAFVGLGASAGLAYTAAQTGAQPQQQWGEQAQLQRGQFGQQYGYGAVDRQYQQHGATGWQQHGPGSMTGPQQQYGQPGMHFGATQQQFDRQQQFYGQPGQQQSYSQPWQQQSYGQQPGQQQFYGQQPGQQQFYGQPRQQQFYGQPGQQQFYGQPSQQQFYGQPQQQFYGQARQEQYTRGFESGVTAPYGGFGQIGAMDQGAQIGVVGVHPGQLQNAVSADRLLNANVRDVTGRNVGNVQDLAVNDNGEVTALIVSVGGFLGLGRSEYRLPWQQAIVSPTAQYVFVPIHEERLEQFRTTRDRDDRQRQQQAQTWQQQAQAPQQQQAQQQQAQPQQQFDQQQQYGQQQQFGRQQQFGQQQHMPIGPELRLSELIDDTVHLRDGQRYGRVDDVLISRDGRIAGVVIWPDRRAQGVPFVQPFDARVFVPARDVHTLAYGPEHLGRIGPFNYLAVGVVGPENRMRDSATARGPADQRGTGAGGQQQARAPQDRDELARDQRAREREMAREQRRQQDDRTVPPGATAPQQPAPAGATAQAGATAR